MSEKALFTQEDCLRTGYDFSINGKVIVLKSPVLSRIVEYADRRRVEEEIIRRHSACVDVPEEADAGAGALGGLLHTSNQEPEVPTRAKAPVRIE